MLTNLVENALKYSPHDTRVTVEVSRQNGGIEVAVSDRGIGTPAQELVQREGAESAPLFERFHRTPEAHASGVIGAGLGLYICRGIIAAHGGRLWAESPGLHLGSTFRFTMPDPLPV